VFEERRCGVHVERAFLAIEHMFFELFKLSLAQLVE